MIKNNFKLNWKVLFNCFNLVSDFKAALDFSNLHFSQWFLFQKFDIIHAHYGHNGAFIADLIAKEILQKVKLVTSFHGYDMWPSKMEQLQIKYKNLIIQQSIKIANTNYSKSLLLNIGFNESDIRVIPVGLDLDVFYSKKKYKAFNEQNLFNLVFCGRLAKVKAPEQTIEIINEIINNRKIKNVRLHIIGEGEMHMELISRIKKYQLDDYVNMHGALNQKQIVSILENSSVFILPGIYEKETGSAETQGLVVQEAQALGLPVIVSNVGGIKFGMVEGRTGYVVDESDIRQYADKIIYLMGNEPVLKKMSIDAKAFVVENYDIRIIGEKLINTYKE